MGCGGMAAGARGFGKVMKWCGGGGQQEGLVALEVREALEARVGHGVWRW